MLEKIDYQIREASVCLDDMCEKHVGRSYVSSSLDVCGLDDGEDYIRGSDSGVLMPEVRFR